MKNRYLFLFFSFAALTGPLYGADGKLGPDGEGLTIERVGVPSSNDDRVDPRVLRDFIESRGLIECRKKCGRLIIAGDVRAKWEATGEEVNGKKKRGFETDTQINQFRSEFNLFLDYETKNSWVATKVKWSRFDGLFFGSEVKTSLDRAFLGYDIYECDKEDIYIELGRSRLDYIFESRVEFNSTFDGIHLFYTNYFPGIGTVIAHGGPFIIDASTNHYGWIVETGVKDLFTKGFSIKYSIIDWARHSQTDYVGKLSQFSKSTFEDYNAFAYLVSQIIFGYEQTIDFAGCKILYLYAAALTNSDAKRRFSTNDRYSNKAWYAGFTLGKLCKAGDWSLDVCYQAVGAQVIPEFDLLGIGHGNADGSFLSDAILLGLAPNKARGFSNYRGWEFVLLYALTDTFSFRGRAAWTRPYDSSIGGNFKYKVFDVTAIYAF